MNPNTQKLHDLGQSLWLDNINRAILTVYEVVALARKLVAAIASDALQPDRKAVVAAMPADLAAD